MGCTKMTNFAKLVVLDSSTKNFKRDNKRGILGLQPHDKAAMLWVNAIEELT